MPASAPSWRKNLAFTPATSTPRSTAYREDAEVAPLYGHWIVEPWPEAADGDSLLRDIIRRIQRHVVITDDNALAVALWLMMAWVHDEIATHSSHSEHQQRRTGKRQVDDHGVLLSFLMPRCIASVEVSEAALYRAIRTLAAVFLH